MCYCWHDRFQGLYDKSTTTTKDIIFPTKAPVTAAPVTAAPVTKSPNAGRRLLATTQFISTNYINSSVSSCTSDMYRWQTRFGVKAGYILVHDLYFTTSFPSTGTVQSTRIAVMATTSEKIGFTSVQTNFRDGLYTAWFQKYSDVCSHLDQTSKFTPTVSRFGSQNSGAIEHQFNFGLSLIHI